MPQVKVAGRGSSRLQTSDQLEHFGSGIAERLTESTQASGDPATEVGELLVVDGFHRALELTGVRLECVELPSEEGSVVATDVFDVIRFVGLEQQERRRAVRGQPLLSEEVRIARCDDPLAWSRVGEVVAGNPAIVLR